MCNIKELSLGPMQVLTFLTKLNYEPTLFVLVVDKRFSITGDHVMKSNLISRIVNATCRLVCRGLHAVPEITLLRQLSQSKLSTLSEDRSSNRACVTAIGWEERRLCDQR